MIAPMCAVRLLVKRWNDAKYCQHWPSMTASFVSNSEQ